eukprot:4765168-Ditylum_brightwellii.AAC.1
MRLYNVCDTFEKAGDIIMAKWHHFVKDVVDSKDLPLINSHGTLQQNKMFCIIKKNLVKKFMKMFKNPPEN